MGVGNLLQDDWFRHCGRAQGSHPWDSRSLTSHQNSTKQYKCLSPVGKRITHSPMSHSGIFDNVLGPHQKMELPRGNPFSWLWSHGWRRPRVIQIGNTHSHSRRGFRLGWMNLLWHLRECGPRRKNSEEVQMIGKTSPHLQVATTMTQLKPSQIPSKRHSLKKKPWVWWKALSPSRRQQRYVGVSLVNFALGLWRPLMKETKFVPYMMVALVGQMPTSSRTAQKRPQHPQWWTVSMVFIGSERPVRRQPQAMLPRDKGRLPMALTPCQKGVCSTGQTKILLSCCWKQMYPRPTGESRFSDPVGSTKSHRLTNSGGSTKWALMV